MNSPDSSRLTRYVGLFVTGSVLLVFELLLFVLTPNLFVWGANAYVGGMWFALREEILHERRVSWGRIGKVSALWGGGAAGVTAAVMAVASAVLKDPSKISLKGVAIGLGAVALVGCLLGWFIGVVFVQGTVDPTLAVVRFFTGGPSNGARSDDDGLAAK